MHLDHFILTPLIEINNKYIIKYNDIIFLENEYNLNINEVINELCFVNNISYNENIILAINESDIILNPKIINNIPYNIAVIPISENNVIYQFCEDCIDAYLESGDQHYMDILLDENKLGDIVHKIKRESNINKSRPRTAHMVYHAKKTYREHNPRINILTGNINYLHESTKKPIKLTYDLRDFAGPDAEEKMKLRLLHAYQSVYNNNKKAIADKIASLNKLGNQLKQREEKSVDIIVKEKLQQAFDKVKYTAKKLLDKITPNFLK